LKGRLPDQILPDVGLDPSLPVLDLDKAGFPKVADGNDPAGHSKDSIYFMEFLIRERTAGFENILRGVLHFILVWERIDFLFS